MPQISYRPNLAAASVPFSGPDQMGQSVIIPGQDHTFSRQLAARADQDRSVGIPQVFYIRNMMPVDGGFAAVISSADVTVDLPFTGNVVSHLPYPISSATEDSNPVFLEFVQNPVPGLLGVLDGVPGVRTAAGLLANTSDTVSLFTINGNTYGFRRLRSPLSPELYRLPSVGAVIPTAVTGLSGTPIDMSAAFGYGLAITSDTFHWSSTTSPFNFTPSLATGAGSFGIQQAIGKLRCILPAATGVYVVAEQNIVFLRYTGNSRFPFAAQAVDGSTRLKRTAINTAFTGDQATDIVLDKARCSDCFLPVDEKIIATASGLYRMTPRNCEAVFGELLQFARDNLGGVREIEVAGTGVFQESQVLDDIARIMRVGNNYITFLFGQAFMWVFDISLQRWGQISGWQLFCDYPTFSLRQSSAAVSKFRNGFLYNISGELGASAYRLMPARQSPGFGETYTGKLVMGRYQYVRERMLELHTVDVRGNFFNVAARALVSLRGGDFTSKLAPSLTTDSGLRDTQFYFNSAVGYNIAVLLEGGLHVNSAVLAFSIHGKVRSY